MKTYTIKPAEVERSWYLIDASELPLGRVATRIANLLIGKSKPSYTPHVDGGDYVVVINASDVQVTGGKKLIDKKYYRHSGYPGSIKSLSLEELIEKNPTKVIVEAVYGMLPKNKLRDGRLDRLKVFPGAEHTHEPQQPKKIELKKKDTK